VAQNDFEEGDLMAKFGKVEISQTRSDWQPVPLPEQVVLVTTIDGDGVPHIATKTRFTVVSYGPPTVIAFVCRTRYPTATNIRTTEELVINVPGEDLVATSWIIGLSPSYRGLGLFEENGLTPIPSLKVSPPRVAECRAHLECRVEESHEVGDKLVAYARVETVSMNQAIVERSSSAVQYRNLAPFFFLEAGWTASLGAARSVESPVRGPRHEKTILAAADLKKTVAFYTDAFDWEIIKKEKSYVEFALPEGRSLSICTRETCAVQSGVAAPRDAIQGSSGVQLYLRCDDLPRVIANLHTAGAAPLSKVRIRDWGDEVAYFADPDGHVIAVARRAK
jgi:flavin reductase (DIM6/NTAB) family NADH-FMN oxidoreductase RutF/predicted enzyme related to lactoylglutathione lyase